jgi:hypothetical protein
MRFRAANLNLNKALLLCYVSLACVKPDIGGVRGSGAFLRSGYSGLNSCSSSSGKSLSDPAKSVEGNLYTGSTSASASSAHTPFPKPGTSALVGFPSQLKVALFAEPFHTPQTGPPSVASCLNRLPRFPCERFQRWLSLCQ